MTQRVTQPLHGRRDAATGRQTGLPSAAQEHSLQDRKNKSYLHLPYAEDIKIWIHYQTKIKACTIQITTLGEKTELDAVPKSSEHFRCHMRTTVAKSESRSALLRYHILAKV